MSVESVRSAGKVMGDVGSNLKGVTRAFISLDCFINDGDTPLKKLAARVGALACNVLIGLLLILLISIVVPLVIGAIAILLIGAAILLPVASIAALFSRCCCCRKQLPSPNIPPSTTI
jgi:hypothetical protein